ncbi:MAG: hypothetical protein K9J32_09255 [Synechococcus lacustris]|nr:hypothetical protein [Synechococcus lacustris]
MVEATNQFLPVPIYVTNKAGTKTATPDLIITEDQISIDTMADYVFPMIGGQEILSVSRSDLINSPFNNNYTPLLDAGSAFTNELPIRFIDASPNIFNTYLVNLNDHIPQGTASSPVSPVESDTTSGTITINLKNLRTNYRVEVEMLKNGSIVSGIIEGGV